jgi:hypothetical protein
VEGQSGSTVEVHLEAEVVRENRSPREAPVSINSCGQEVGIRSNIPGLTGLFLRTPCRQGVNALAEVWLAEVFDHAPIELPLQIPKAKSACCNCRCSGRLENQ